MARCGLTVIVCLLLAGGLIAGPTSAGRLATVGASSTLRLLESVGSNPTGFPSLVPDVQYDNDVGVSALVPVPDVNVPFGDTVFLRCEVKNFGLQTQTDIPVICVLYDTAADARVYGPETVHVTSLDSGGVDTVEFPCWVPPAEEKVYFDTMATVLPGDEDTTNDWKANEVVVTEWGSLCANYTDQTWENGTRYVTSPYDGEYCTEFTMVGEVVTGANIWLSDIPASNLNKRVRVYAMDGAGGAPGTVLKDQVMLLAAGYWPTCTKNAITFSPPVAVPPTVTKIGISYGWNLGVAQFVCIDQNPVITVGNDWGRAGPANAWDHTLSNTADNACDLGLEACFRARLLDGTIVDITSPPATIDSNTTFKPQIVVKNVGLKDRTNIPVGFNITRTSDPTDTMFVGTANSGPVAIGEAVPVEFPTDVTPDPDFFNMTGISMMPFDTHSSNDTLAMPLFVRYLDVLCEIVSPRPTEVPGLVQVNVRLTNTGNVDAVVPWLHATISPTVFSGDYGPDIPLAAGVSKVYTLGSWVCPPGGNETCTAWIDYPADMNHVDPISADTDVVAITTGIPGWTEVAPLLGTPSGKMIKDGGCLAYDALTDVIYASKGNKSGDFYKYTLPAGTWTNLTGIPLGAEGKMVYKGSVLCADGNGKLYLTKGNNTDGFWEYDANATPPAWTPKAPVPLGSSGKKVKQGAGLAWGTDVNDTGYVYLLKGYRNEFHRYNPRTNAWNELLSAPIGAASHVKWDAGSWLVSDPTPGAHLLYAFKAKYHEMYTYDIVTGLWSAAKAAMPIPGPAGAKKAKDGSCAAWYSGKIYALKGAGTNEFWRYFPLGDSWHTQFDIPLISSTGARKKVKAGAALAGYPGTGVYAFKGNKSLEFWRYTPYEVAGAEPSREGVMAGSTQIGSVSFAIAPNPLSGGLATVRYSLPKAGLATLYVYDVTGRTVLTQTMAAGRTGTAGLDLRKLDAGVYLVKVATEGFSATQKLVVEH